MSSANEGPDSTVNKFSGVGRKSVARRNVGQNNVQTTSDQAREAKVQRLLHEYSERQRQLTKERQAILHNQAMWTGKVEPLNLGGDAEARRAQRELLSQQLQQDQAAAEALVEALKENKTYREAQLIAQRVAREMEEIRRGSSPSPNTPPTTTHHQSMPQSLQGSGRTAAAASGAGINVLPRRLGSQVRIQEGGADISTGAVRSTSLLQSRNTAPPPKASGTHLPSTYAPAGAAPKNVPQSAVPRGTLTSPTSVPYSELPPPPQTSLIYHEPESRRNFSFPINHQRPSYDAGSRGLTPDSNDAVEQLKQQVKALQIAVETQMARQQQQQQPIIVMPPQYAAPPQPAQPQAAPTAHQNAGLSSEFHSDPEIREAHFQYQREMALLKMQIEKARGEAELEQIRGTLQQMRSTAAAASGASLVEVPSTAQNNVILTNIESDQNRTLYGRENVPDFNDDQDEDDEDEDDEDDEDEDDETLTDSPAAPGLNPTGGIMNADVLQVFLQNAGPFQKRGTYRMRIVLYDGYQPVLAGPDIVVGASGPRRPASDKEGALFAVWNTTLILRGLRLSPTMMLVFELYLAKQAVAGLPTPENVVAWGFCSVMAKGELLAGTQSAPLHRLPLMITAQRKFSFNGAMINFSITKSEGQPGDITNYNNDMSDNRGSRGGELSYGGNPLTKEDVVGVPADAWCRVTRGVPPLDPFTPGEGFVLIIDGARFLPANVTISKVIASLWSSDKKQLIPQYYEAVSLPDSNAYLPRYSLQTTLGQGTEKFDNATATLLFVLHSVCRWERVQRVVGYGALPVYLDPQTQLQPTSKNIRDYILNQGAMQIPLHIAPTPPDLPFRGDSLESVPRLPCASLLVRLLSPEAAKTQRRKPTPNYVDRVYDTTRDVPIPVERKLYAKYLARKPLAVREAARLLVVGKPVEARRAAMGTLQPSPPAEAGSRSQGGSGRAEQAQPGASSGRTEPAVVVQEVGGVIPNTDAELMDWMEDRLRSNTQVPLNYNLASEYFQDLGFYVAVDGAMRLDRQLPSAALITFAPPGSFYLDNPVVDDMKATLDYDMYSTLACPRWTDGFQQFDNVIYEPGLAIIFDVRLLIPATGASSPAGWTVLPVFEKTGAYVATGSYHLPLFQGVPSRAIVQEIGNKGDVETVIVSQLKSGRLRVSEECSSVLVRLMDGSRQGQLEVPSGQGPSGLKDLRLPGYLTEIGGAKFLSAMRKETKNKTYSQAKAKNLTDDAWVQELNNCILKVAGLDVKTAVGQQDEEEDKADAGGDSAMPKKQQMMKNNQDRKKGAVGSRGNQQQLNVGEGSTPAMYPSGMAGYGTYSVGPNADMPMQSGGMGFGQQGGMAPMNTQMGMMPMQPNQQGMMMPMQPNQQGMMMPMQPNQQGMMMPMQPNQQGMMMPMQPNQQGMMMPLMQGMNSFPNQSLSTMMGSSGETMPVQPGALAAAQGVAQQNPGTTQQRKQTQIKPAKIQGRR